MLKKIDKLIIKEFIGPFLLIFFITIFILFYQFVNAEFHNLLNKDLNWFIYLKVIFYFCISLVPTASSMAVLLSTLMTFGSLGQHAELVAIKGAGISLPRILLPVFIIVIFITLICFLFNNTIVLKANFQLRKTVIEISKEKPIINLSKGLFYNQLSGYSIRTEDKNVESNDLYGLMIYDHTKENGNTQVTTAESGKIVNTRNKEYVVIELFNGSSFHESEKPIDIKEEDEKIKFLRNKFSYGKIYINASESRQDSFQLEKKMMPIHLLKLKHDSLRIGFNNLKFDLQKQILPKISQISISENKTNIKEAEDLYHQKSDTHILLAYKKAKSIQESIDEKVMIIERNQREIRSYLVEVTKRYVDVAAILVMFLIGAPIGVIVKKGGLGVPILLATFLFSGYSFLLNFSFKSVKEGALPIEIGCWLSPAILTLIGLFFLNQARKDNNLLEMDYYSFFLSKIFRKKEKK